MQPQIKARFISKDFHLIHPTNKKSVGLRLAYIALNRKYNKAIIRTEYIRSLE